MELSVILNTFRVRSFSAGLFDSRWTGPLPSSQPRLRVAAQQVRSPLYAKISDLDFGCTGTQQEAYIKHLFVIVVLSWVGRSIITRI